ncbi:MAG: hypothetical protein QOE90_2792 [Thermoplasmata archaeon]|jgi:hypothetical protein|nr:hypothetical protein [Thermoplasmata archaeon]
MSLPQDAKKAYGLVTAVGTKLGERARSEPDLIEALRAAPDLDAFRALVRQSSEGLLAPALVESYLALTTEADWKQWRSRLLLQAKLVRDGGERAPGHEHGKGIGRP